MNRTSFQIYQASAGSGKTYSLVREYLVRLLSLPKKDDFRQLLAITFTNKAVAEMKSRILENLHLFSSGEGASTPIFQEVAQRLKIDNSELTQRSKHLLHWILHNYAFFDIATIDSFNHRLIRTFAHDLHLSNNFEVALDTDELLQRTVDLLLDRAGEDESLTQILVAYALDKAAEDKSWDIAYDLRDVAALLKSENNLLHLEKLDSKNLQDFDTLKQHLQSRIEQGNQLISKRALAVLQLLEENGLQPTDFSYSQLPNHFKKAAALEYTKLYASKFEEKLQAGEVYTKSLDEEKKQRIDGLLPGITEAFFVIKQTVYQTLFYKRVLQGVTPLSVLSLLQQTLRQLCEEENILLISDFNRIISESIKGQPVPFIYERLGNRYKHFYIDEFQDTSVLQWQNIMPLIEHSLVSEEIQGQVGSLLLVGDAKQSIYRWRGGKPEQFIALLGHANPFPVRSEVIMLEHNFRSLPEIVSFNNRLYEYSASCMQHPAYQTLYENATQKITETKNGGYVHISFIDARNRAEEDDLYPLEVLNIISSCLQQGYSLGDICILTRKKDEGICIAETLTEHGIQVVSSETLLLRNSEKVQFLIDLLTYLQKPYTKTAKAQLLYFFAHRHLEIDVHSLMAANMEASMETLFEALEPLGYQFNYADFMNRSLYEGIIYAIEAFALSKGPDPFLQAFLEEVFALTKKENGDLITLLEYWEAKKDRLSISIEMNDAAVRIMTIHKAKGLEFPVVIFPYANHSLQPKSDTKVWMEVDSKAFSGFDEVYFRASKDMEHYSEDAHQTYESLKNEVFFDQMNLLYVATTRAEEQLYIIGKHEKTDTLTNVSSLLRRFLKSQGIWSETQSVYTWGQQKQHLPQKGVVEASRMLDQFIISPRNPETLKFSTQRGLVWDSSRQAAIEKGNLIHLLLSKINTKADIENVLSVHLQDGFMEQEDLPKMRAILNQILEHPQLQQYFEEAVEAYNEREIVTIEGNYLRPDRLVFHQKEVIVIDYKTGSYQAAHEEQLVVYASVLEEMGFKVAKKLLVFIGDQITVLSV